MASLRRVSMSGPRAAAAIVPIACRLCPWLHVGCLIARQHGNIVGLLPFTRPAFDPSMQALAPASPARSSLPFQWLWQACRCKCARSVNHEHTLTEVSAFSRGCSCAG